MNTFRISFSYKKWHRIVLVVNVSSQVEAIGLAESAIDDEIPFDVDPRLLSMEVMEVS